MTLSSVRILNPNLCTLFLLPSVTLMHLMLRKCFMIFGMPCFKEVQCTKITHTDHSLSCRCLLLLNTRIISWRLVQLGLSKYRCSLSVLIMQLLVHVLKEKKKSQRIHILHTFFSYVVLQHSFAEWKQSIETKDC